jgi:hypothetical protein
MMLQATKFSRTIFVCGVLAIGFVTGLVALGQTQTQSQPQTSAAAQAVARALANLYQVAQSIIKDPAGEAEEHPGGPPTFPYPASMQAQWDSAIADNSGGLTPQEREQYVPCAGHLNNAIMDTEQGYTVEDTQPKSNTGAQESAQKSYAEGKAEFAQCNPSAFALAQSEVGSSAATPQQGGTDTTVSPDQTPAPAENPPAATPEPAPENPPVAGTPETPTSATAPPANTSSNGAIPGSVEESEEPGSIDWTPTLDPLFTYLSKEWNLVASDPKNKDWAGDTAGNTLKLKLQPNQAPEVESITGARSSSLRSITENGLPVTRFPNGSRLSSVEVAPTFNVKPKMGTKRTRMKYYERNGIFKSYQVAE